MRHRARPDSATPHKTTPRGDVASARRARTNTHTTPHTNTEHTCARRAALRSHIGTKGGYATCAYVIFAVVYGPCEMDAKSNIFDVIRGLLKDA